MLKGRQYTKEQVEEALKKRGYTGTRERKKWADRDMLHLYRLGNTVLVEQEVVDKGISIETTNYYSDGTAECIGVMKDI